MLICTEGSKKEIGFWKIILVNCSFHGIKIIELALLIQFGNHGNKHNCIKKTVLILIKKVVIKYSFFLNYLKQLCFPWQ